MATDWGKKDPDEVIDYGIEYSGSLADGDALVSVVWTFIDQAGCTKSNEGVVGTQAKVRISAGTAGLNMKIQCRVTTANGEILEDDAKLRIRNTT
jgi:hypothetical protein